MTPALQRTTRRLKLPFYLGIGIFVLAGCTEPSVEPPPRPAKVVKQSARVDLPNPVKLEAKLPPEKHTDGHFRIDGLIARRGQYFEQDVGVRGYLVDRVTCPKKAKRCTIPHLVIADTPAGDGERVLVVELPEDDLPKMTIGEQLVVQGKLARSSSDGFVRTKGLLLYRGISKPEAN